MDVWGGTKSGAGDLPRPKAPLEGGGGGCPPALASASWARREAMEGWMLASPRDAGVAGAGGGGGSEAAIVCCQASDDLSLSKRAFMPSAF